MSDKQQQCAMTTSEYHCGNCPFAEATNMKMYPFKCHAQKPIPMMVHENCVNWFRYVGCLSHPSAQAALRAEGAKQERGLMLIPLITWLRKKRKYYGTCSGSNANDDPEDCDPYNTVLLKIESLRQSQSTGGEQGINHELY